MTTGASKPAARGGSRRKGSTCAPEVGGGPSKPKRWKKNALSLRTIIFTHTHVYIYHTHAASRYAYNICWIDTWIFFSRLL
jgi:hypothetical protein